MSKLNHPGSYNSYIVGFVLSFIFTVSAYIIVQQHLASGDNSKPPVYLILLIVVFALAQLVAQLVFFLHLGRESKPRWNLMVSLFAVMVVGIVVFGSLWIMQNLNYHVHPQDAEEYIIKDEGY